MTMLQQERKMEENGVEIGGLEGNGRKWGEMGENGKLLQVHHGKCVTMFQQERKMEENGVEIGGMRGNGG